MSYIRPDPLMSPAELRAGIKDCEAILDAAAANPPPVGSLDEMMLGILRDVRDRTAARLAASELLDRVVSRRPS